MAASSTVPSALVSLAEVKVPLWSVTQDSSANAQQTLTKAAAEGVTHYVCGFEVITSAAASAAAETIILLKDGTTTVYKSCIGASAARGTRVSIMFPFPIKMTAGAAAVLNVAAAGASCVTTANMIGYSA